MHLYSMYFTMTTRIELHWVRFRRWRDVIDSDDYGFPCVYLLADVDKTPLYIGATTQKSRKISGKLWAGGLRARYYHD